MVDGSPQCNGQGIIDSFRVTTDQSVHQYSFVRWRVLPCDVFRGCTRGQLGNRPFSAVREAAVKLVRLRGDNAGRFSQEAWDTLLADDPSPDDCALAYRKAKRACEILPDHPGFLNNLGGSAYRVGAYDEAQFALEKAVDLRREPLDLIFLAMTRFQLGRYDDAEVLLAEAESALGDPHCAAEVHTQRFCSEAKAVIRGAVPDPRPGVDHADPAGN